MPAVAGPLVSIIVPTYRRLTYLSQAIESALAQTFTDYELLVTDNSESPQVESLVLSYHDPRLRYRRNDTNVGPLRNVLAGVRDSHGPFVALLHDDDLWEPEFLATLLPPLQQDVTLALSFSDHYLIDASGALLVPQTERSTRLWGRARLPEGRHAPFGKLALVDRAVPVAVSTVLRRSAIDWWDVPDEVGPAYDLWLAYLAARDGQGAYYVGRRLTRNRVHPGSATSAGPHDDVLVRLYARVLADPRLEYLRHDLQREAAGFHTGHGLSLLRAGGCAREARREILTSLRFRPTLRAALALAVSVAPKSALLTRRLSGTSPRTGRGSRH